MTARIKVLKGIFAALSLLVGAVVAESPGFLIVSAPRNGLISWIRLPEGNGETAYSHEEARPLVDEGLRHPQGIAVDQKRKRLFVADPDVRKIFSYQLRLDKDELKVAGGQRVVAHGAESRWVTVDEVGNIFFSDEPRNLILKVAAADLENSDKKPQVIYDGATNSEVSEPGGVAVDNFHLYWANKHLGTRSGSVVRGSEGFTGASKHTHVLAKNAVKSYGLCMALGNIYYTGAAKSVYGVSKSGGQVAEVTSSLTSPRGCAFDGDGTVYVADRGQNAIYAFPGSSHQIRRVQLTKAFHVEDAFGLAVATQESPEMDASSSDSRRSWSLVETHMHAPVQPVKLVTHRLALLSESKRGRNSTASNSSAEEATATNSNSSAEAVSDSNETEIEIEAEKEWPKKSKIALAVINGLGLGFCGVDRCYMGGAGLGLLKFVTLGGFMVWGLTDFIMIMLNCLEKAERIDTIGYRAVFFKDEIEPAFWLSITLTLVNIFGIIVAASRVTSRHDEVGMDQPPPSRKLDA